MCVEKRVRVSRNVLLQGGSRLRPEALDSRLLEIGWFAVLSMVHNRQSTQHSCEF